MWEAKRADLNRNFDAIDGLDEGSLTYLFWTGRICITEAQLTVEQAASIGVDVHPSIPQVILSGYVITRKPYDTQEARVISESRGWNEVVVGFADQLSVYAEIPARHALRIHAN